MERGGGGVYTLGRDWCGCEEEETRGPTGGCQEAEGHSLSSVPEELSVTLSSLWRRCPDINLLGQVGCEERMKARRK